MATPRHETRFATSEDGAKIAFWDIGSGSPVVIAHNVTLSHVGLDWAVPSLASFYSGLASRHRVIRFDPRRCGLSDRRPELEMTTAAVGSDISAVADSCDLDEFTLLGVSAMGAAVIEYAARFPSRVSHLILCDADLRVATSKHANYIKGLVALTEIQGGPLASSLYIKVAPKADLEAMSALLSASPPDLEPLGDEVLKWDAEPTVESVKAPTLIILSRDSILSSLDEARRIAANIPNAQLLMVDGEFAPYFADQQAELEAIADHLGSGSYRDPEPSGAFRTIMFTDLVSSTALTQQHGDDGAQEILKVHDEVVREALAGHKGTEVKHTGDGIMAWFDSATEASRAALEISNALFERDVGVRVGLNAGEPINQDGDLFGTAVQLAARVCDHAASGEVLATAVVRDLTAGKNLIWRPRPDFDAKGIDEPVTVFALESD